MQVPALPDGKVNAIRAVGCNSLHFNWNVNSLVCSRSCQWCVWLHGSICWNRTCYHLNLCRGFLKSLFEWSAISIFILLSPTSVPQKKCSFFPPVCATVWITHAVTERGTLAVKSFWTVRFFKCFFIKLSFAHQTCIYLMQKQQKQ